VGSPTEVALYVMARKLGMSLPPHCDQPGAASLNQLSTSPHSSTGVERSKEEMTSVWEKMAEYPFDSTIKLMSVALFNKGTPTTIFIRASLVA
jgi:magnesium-transporting ATPase (P-type)